MPLPVTQDTIFKRLLGFKDARGPAGIYSRGKNVYRGASHTAHSKGKFGKGGATTPTSLITALAQRRILNPTTTKAIAPAAITPPATAPTSLDQYPYDKLYDIGMQDVTKQQSELQSNADLARQRLLQDYGLSQGELQRGYQQNADALTQRMANQGILRSGITIKGQSDLGSEYGRENENLGRTESRGLEDISRQLSSGQNQLTHQQQLLDYDRAERLKQQQLEQANREAEAKANEALLKSLQPTPSGTIPLSNRPIGQIRAGIQKRHPNLNTSQLNLAARKAKYGHGGLQLARRSGKSVPVPDSLEGAISRRVGL